MSQVFWYWGYSDNTAVNIRQLILPESFQNEEKTQTRKYGNQEKEFTLVMCAKSRHLLH